VGKAGEKLGFVGLVIQRLIASVLLIAERSVASKGVTERKRRHKRDVRCGCQTGRLCVKSFSPAVGGGWWENFFKDKWVFSIKEFFFQR
jgi:hypothetical protein